MGQLRRFYALAQEKRGEQFYIESDYTHLAKVMRAKEGMRFTVSILGEADDYLCQVSCVTDRRVVLNILEQYPNERESAVEVTLFAGCLKGDAADRLVQEAVELGVKKIIFFRSAYTVSDVDGKKAQRFERVARETCKQCCRNALVEVPPAITFAAMAESLKEYQKAYFCCEREGEGVPIADALDNALNSVALVVGSEGGFSEEEIQTLKKHSTAVSLGKRILRAHTASLYALSVIDAHWSKK